LGGLEFDPVISDVEELNEWALEGCLDVTKLSYHTYLKVRDEYALLRSGSALGFGCGPLLIARTKLSEEDIIQGPIAIPGELTTAHMLFRLRYPGAHHKHFLLFSDVENAVLKGDAVAGVIIHENRFTYADKGLVKITDLGEFWESETGTPIPLGAIVAKKSLGDEVIRSVDRLISDSVSYAFAHPEASEGYVLKYAAEMDPEVTKKHIETYVNDFSVDLGPVGLSAIQALELRAKSAGII
jgi:1,4-dihydroxy-6-naphthoate synthase